MANAVVPFSAGGSPGEHVARRALVVFSLALLMSVSWWGAGAHPAAAQGAGEFVDTRAVSIDLAEASAGDRWRVTIFNGADDGRTTFRLSVLSSPAAVLSVDPDTVDLAAGRTGHFTLTLTRAEPASGQLVLLGDDGSLLRRDLRIDRLSDEAAVPPALNLSGWRLAPFCECTRIDDTVLPGLALPGGRRVVGLVTSASGDAAQVVRDGDRVTARGVHRPGRFEGKVQLVAGIDTAVSLEVRDAIFWPLLVLVGGLLLVGVLDRFTRSTAPRRGLAIRLARLRREVVAAQADARRELLALEPRPAGVHRAAREGGGPELMLDIESVEALTAWDLGDEEGRSSWGEQGADWLRVRTAADDFVELLRRSVQLGRDYAAFVGGLPSPESTWVDRSPVLREVWRALNPVAITGRHELDVAIAHTEAAGDRLRAFQRVRDHVLAVREEAYGDTRRQADALLESLWSAADLDTVKERADELYERALTERTPQGVLDGATLPAGALVPPPPLPPPAAVVPPPVSSPAVAPKKARQARTRVLVPLAILVVAGAAGLTTLAVVDGDESRPTTGDAARPPAAGRTTTTVAEIPAGEAQAGFPVGGTRRAAPGGDSSRRDLWLLGVALPGALLMALLVVGVPLARRLGGRRDAAGAPLETLVARQRRDEWRFALLSALLVVLSGLSVLYFPRPIFGSVGDYLTVLLWGTGVGEGLQLVRRLLPSFGGLR